MSKKELSQIIFNDLKMTKDEIRSMVSETVEKLVQRKIDTIGVDAIIRERIDHLLTQVVAPRSDLWTRYLHRDIRASVCKALINRIDIVINDEPKTEDMAVYTVIRSSDEQDRD